MWLLGQANLVVRFSLHFVLFGQSGSVLVCSELRVASIQYFCAVLCPAQHGEGGVVLTIFHIKTDDRSKTPH